MSYKIGVQALRRAFENARRSIFLPPLELTTRARGVRNMRAHSASASAFHHSGDGRRCRLRRPGVPWKSRHPDAELRPLLQGERALYGLPREPDFVGDARGAADRTP